MTSASVLHVLQRGCTALYLACEGRKTFAALTLINFGCDWDLSDKVRVLLDSSQVLPIVAINVYNL